MKRFKYNKGIISQLIQQFNPFGLLNSAGEPQVFHNTSDAYLYVLVKLYVMAPRGFVEMPLFLAELYPHLSFPECKVLTTDMQTLGIYERNFVEYETKNGKKFLECLCRALHSLCESKFDSSAFEHAYQLLLNRIELEKTETEKPH